MQDTESPDDVTEAGRFILPDDASAVVLYPDGTSAVITPRVEDNEVVPASAMTAILLYTCLHEGEAGVERLKEHMARGKAAAN